ncbi:uncharacterized protein BYT42DRAFT_85139 [Radiomyces spectabilis]|uniref:uncharacterized protein n=1 Tax=Radiomyces spectabilis TaxID=64574 RepID=UPI00221FB621|nr:uncharacterized protein BYT42DRAFT_85139 [Radiomyces spectabilis]KAI8370352.1 hypothetical protein BYT42DRAFT_85139 [Radiomyces spectabilis]
MIMNLVFIASLYIFVLISNTVAVEYPNDQHSPFSDLQPANEPPAVVAPINEPVPINNGKTQSAIQENTNIIYHSPESGDDAIAILHSPIEDHEEQGDEIGEEEIEDDVHSINHEDTLHPHTEDDIYDDGDGEYMHDEDDEVDDEDTFLDDEYEDEDDEEHDDEELYDEYIEEDGLVNDIEEYDNSESVEDDVNSWRESSPTEFRNKESEDFEKLASALLQHEDSSSIHSQQHAAKSVDQANEANLMEMDVEAIVDAALDEILENDATEASDDTDRPIPVSPESVSGLPSEELATKHTSSHRLWPWYFVLLFFILLFYLKFSKSKTLADYYRLGSNLDKTGKLPLHTKHLDKEGGNGVDSTVDIFHNYSHAESSPIAALGNRRASASYLLSAPRPGRGRRLAHHHSVDYSMHSNRHALWEDWKAEENEW